MQVCCKKVHSHDAHMQDVQGLVMISRPYSLQASLAS